MIMPLGPDSPVLDPAIVAIGVASPVAPAAYSVIESLLLATNRSPEPSSATEVGVLSPVFEPERVVLGVAFPDAPGAYSVTLAPMKFETYSVPSEPGTASLGALSPVFEPEIVSVGVAL